MTVGVLGVTFHRTERYLVGGARRKLTLTYKGSGASNGVFARWYPEGVLWNIACPSSVSQSVCIWVGECE